MENWQKIATLIITFLPTLYEAWSDRFGENKKDKFKDTILLLVGSIILTVGAYLVMTNWIAVPLLILMWRVTCFDYLAHWFLKRYSDSHRKINILTYTGKTAKWDKLISKVNPFVRLAVRVSLFSAVLWWFLI